MHGVLNSFIANKTTLNGDLNLSGGLRQLSLASTTASPSSGSPTIDLAPAHFSQLYLSGR